MDKEKFPSAPGPDPVPQHSIPKYQGESWSPSSAYTPGSTGETTTSAQFPGPRGTCLEPSGHKNQGTARDRILLVFVCTLELTLCHSSPYTNFSQSKLVSKKY